MKLAFLLLSALLVFSCKEDKAPSLSAPVIRYGTGSPWCSGYCQGILEINPTLKVYKRIANDDSPDQYCIEPVSEQEWADLLALLDENAFAALPERIGCPGCIDLPYAQIEIEIDTLKHAVSFDPYTVPQEIEVLYDALNEITLSDCDIR